MWGGDGKEQGYGPDAHSRIRELGSKGAKEVCLGILHGTLSGLQKLSFLAYKGIGESNWGSPASFCPLVGTESNSEPHDHLLPLLPPGGLVMAAFIFHPRARGFERFGVKPTGMD